MSHRAQCGDCPTDEEFECCVCFSHLCLSERHKNAICFKCRTNHAMVKSFPRSDLTGAVLHPVTMRPLLMCACGLVWNQICSFSCGGNVTVGNGEHRMMLEEYKSLTGKTDE